MRRALGLTTLCIALVAGGPPGAHAAERKRGCQRGDLVVQTQRVRVVDIADGLYFACLRSSLRKGFTVADARHDSEFERGGLRVNVDAGGIFVAAYLAPFDPVGFVPSCQITEWNVRTRKKVQSFDPRVPLTTESCGQSSLVLAPGGQLAWISGPQGGPAGPPEARVHTRSIGGAAKVLDAGPTVDPASLRIRRSLASWTSAGMARSADLALP